MLENVMIIINGIVTIMLILGRCLQFGHLDP